MKPLSFMLIAGEASGDLLAAELVQALRSEVVDAEVWNTDEVQPLRTPLEPRFFGAGGPRMKAAGMELAFDMTQHSVIGLSDALKNYFKFRRLFNQLYRLALDRQPDVIICVDFSGFNRRFAQAIKRYVRARRDWFHDWNPKIVQYVSPQVWASREGRAYQLARDVDLLLSIFPFEKEWYAKRVPGLRVEFVGHPIIDRYSKLEINPVPSTASADKPVPQVLLLPGSRPDELRRHLPIMLEAVARIRASRPETRAEIVLPVEKLQAEAKSLSIPTGIEVHVGGLSLALTKATIAIASTGTVTLECAYFGVPIVAIYKTSWSNFQIAKRIVNVSFLAMPNLLAGEEIFPEFLQDDATSENISRAALEFLNNEARRKVIKARLMEVVAKLGEPGASGRAAKAIVNLLRSSQREEAVDLVGENS